jgi:4-amino-4-deoxy-L-arabinose transferase-like glycosyltransferase
VSSAPTETPAVATTSYAALGRDGGGGPRPDARRRLTPLVQDSDRRWGWIGPLLVTALAGVLRLWQLGRPNALLFDETYYAKDAYSMLVHGYVRDTVDKADERILRGDLDRLFTDSASFYVHPDLGKWLIAAGEQVFGMDSFGWRVAAAVVGTLMVLVLARLVRRLTGSTLLGCAAGLLLCFDGLHFVMSRLALLDIFLAFFLLCAVACLAADRDWGRLRMARALPPPPPSASPSSVSAVSGASRSHPSVSGASRRHPSVSGALSPWAFGPVRGLLLRPWRVAAGVCFGLACATKWSGAFVLVAFGLLTWGWDSSARRAIGVRWPVWKSALVDSLPALGSLVVAALLVYVASWGSWLANAGEFEDRLGSDWGSYVQQDASGTEEIAQSLRSLWHFHREVWGFHTGDGLADETHPYMSDPRGWLIVNRPVGIDANPDIQPGEQGCSAPDNCIEQVLAIGTPVLWWGGVAALLASLFFWLGARDWRFGLALIGVLSSWLPWWRFSERPIFFFYAVSLVPFTIIAVTLVLGKVLGPPGASARRRRWGAAVAGAFVLAVAANFAFFHPILTDGLLSNEDWLDRMWFTRWI